jgi:hypothetical protein
MTGGWLRRWWPRSKERGYAEGRVGRVVGSGGEPLQSIPDWAFIAGGGFRRVRDNALPSEPEEAGEGEQGEGGEEDVAWGAAASATTA